MKLKAYQKKVDGKISKLEVSEEVAHKKAELARTKIKILVLKGSIAILKDKIKKNQTL